MKRCTLRVAISTLVSGLIVACSLSIVTALYYGMKKALYQTTSEMMDQLTLSVGDKLTQRLDRVEYLNRFIADLIHSGTLNPAEEGKFTDFLQQIVAANPAITLIDCGLPSGHKFQALRMPDGSVSLRLVHRTAGAVVSTWKHRNPAYAATYRGDVASLRTGYDPRTRPWWRAAVQAGKMAWTDLYSSKAGLNYANVNPIYGRRDGLVCVVAINMRLEDLSQFLSRLQESHSIKPFIIDQDCHVIAMPLARERDLGELVKSVTSGGWNEYTLRDISELSDGSIRHAVMRYRQDPNMRDRSFLTFHDPSGQVILASFRPAPRYKFTFGVVVPEDSILGSIKRDLRLTLLLTALFLLAALAVAFRVSSAVSRPLATLAREVDRIRQLDFADAPEIRTIITEVLLIDQSIQNMRMGLRSFRKYVPADVVTRLLALQKEAVIEGEKRELTIFFSDIAEFTGISERLAPEALVGKLGRYFEEVTRILIRHSGTVDKFIGDAVMAFWGAPAPLANHAELACRAALEAQAGIRELNRRWQAEGGEVFHTRMGIHTGEALVGNIGFEGRMNYTTIGDAVNLASRLEGLNKFYGTRILVSEATRCAAGDAVLARMVDLVAVKGKAQATGIYELIAMRGEATAGQVAWAARMGAAFDHYRHQRWAEALDLLQGTPEEPDQPARLLISRCRYYQGAPPEPGWDGVFRHHEK